MRAEGRSNPRLNKKKECKTLITFLYLIIPVVWGGGGGVFLEFNGVLVL